MGWRIGTTYGTTAGPLPDDVPARAAQERDPIVLPHDAPARGRRPRQQRPDVKRKGERAARSSGSHTQSGREGVEEEEAEYHKQEDIPKQAEGHGQEDLPEGTEYHAQGDSHEAGDVQPDGGTPATTQEADIDFFTGADTELARFILQGEGSGSGSVPHASAAGPSGFQVTGPPTDMYEVFTCSPSTIDQLAQEFVSGCGADEAVIRPEQPLHPHVDPSQQPQAFQQTSPHQQYMHYSPQPQAFQQTSPHQQYMHYSPQPQASPHQMPSSHQIVRPKAQRPQRDRHAPPCRTSSHLFHHPAQGGDQV
ncbi:hypothetical protein PIB30_005234 [Stylosanthes scabra]|uniref:Uncharacterized protein n=1 Tax=Stylosanthes scabra TaxID=79078 RepID=A0ABU6T4N1_9FABA|nr:hypothetical protein [Stylosanthes scabra]